ncbi:MAG: hypothetical protein QMC79_00785 [Anaerosomatales bacterium]|nr:hypothetical protein [Anaerosomatales bacterium]
MRINLLPPEILEKRRAEKRIVYVALVAVVLFVVLAGVWVLGYLRVESRRDTLDTKEQEIQATQAQAQQLAIFEQKESELQARKAVAEEALAARRNWAKLFDEVSLVLPNDIWIGVANFGEDAGLKLDGYAVDSDEDSPDLGHKAIAKMLVRLADLDQLYDVWLTNSVKTLYEQQGVIQFSATSKVATTTAGVSAPPTETNP